ncbi:tripartite motif-containing protein 5-like isoform X2 [Scylla paramamosain]
MELPRATPSFHDDNMEDCPVCFLTFDDILARPRNLPCGHTFCTPCVNALQKDNQTTCPTCRVIHYMPEAGEFPIAYAVETLIKRLRGATLTSQPPTPGKDTAKLAAVPLRRFTQKRTVGLSRKAQSLLKVQEAKILTAIRTCQEVQAQLDQYQTTLIGWGKQQQQLQDQLQALMDQSKSANMLVHREEAQVAAKKLEVHQGEQQLHALLQTLRTAAPQHEVYEVIDSAEHYTEEESQRAEAYLRMFPDVHSITTITKVRKAITAALEVATTVQAAQEIAGSPISVARDSSLAAAPSSSIMHRLEIFLTPDLKIEDLRRLTLPATELLEASLVFAVHHMEGRSRHARISLQDNRLYLHSLRNQPPPPGAVIVQMKELVPACPPCLVFMDLAWPGSARRRVLIHLTHDTPRGQQFLLLCTGQQGPSYANTRLFKLVKEGRPGERVWGGDYEYNNGMGGAALLPDLDKGEYGKSTKAGGLWWWWGRGPARGAQFTITINDCPKGVERPVFGEVVEGLDSVEAAARHRPITEVTVVECGVVLWN